MGSEISNSTSSLNTNVQTANTDNTTSPLAVPPPPAQLKTPPPDPKADAKAASASKQHAADRKYEQHVGSQAVKDNLHKQVSAGASATDATGLRKGESISAKVTQDREGFHFEFQRPVTKEQAAAIIFQNGQVPKDAKLVPGKGNTWTVQVPNDLDSRHNAAHHFNAHTETIVQPPRKPDDQFFPESFNQHTWVGGASNTNTGPQRNDLNNDMGFKITKHYKLDEGQRKPESLGQKGQGYEVAFDKPMTKDEVMKKLFDEKKITQGEARLVPMTPEPTTMWRVEVMGSDALTAFTRKASRAFGDSSVYTKASLPTGTPAGVRSHIENQTIPKNAKHHAPDVYVWEQDGYMMYVKSNNKGKDGYYEPQITKMPNEEQGKKWMRGYMIDEGMPPAKAWQTFWQDTVEISQMQLAMISNAVRPPHVFKVGTPKSSFGDAPGPSGRRGGASVPHSPSAPRNAEVDVHASTQPGKSLKPPKPDPLESTHQVPVKPANPKGGQSEVGNANTQPAPQPKGQPPKTQQTLESKDASKGIATPDPHGQQMTHVRGGRVYRHYPLPGDDTEITIQTTKGPEKMKGLEYRLRESEARDWVMEQHLHPDNLKNVTGAGPSPELYKRAAQRFGLNEGWQRNSNPISKRIETGR
jgi:hypothetical protein